MNKKEMIDCTGDAVVGDVITWTEAVFTGSYRRPTFAGERTITGKVVNDSYGERRGQHTFTVEVIEAVGLDPPAVGKKIRRKGRNVYKNGTEREEWEDESARRVEADNKHDRGDVVRRRRNRDRLARDIYGRDADASWLTENDLVGWRD